MRSPDRYGKQLCELIHSGRSQAHASKGSLETEIERNEINIYIYICIDIDINMYTYIIYHISMKS